jgi:hypothetical protein
MRVLITVIALFLAQMTVADTLKIPVGTQGQTIEKPSLGQTMTTVKAAYGEPEKVSGPTGEPPITRWDYSAFSVYFEHDSVLHSVVRHQPQTATSPES